MEERFDAFTSLIASINHSIRKLKTEIMAEFDLKSTHLYCIYYLHRSEKLTAKELCDLCGEDKALISRTIKSLEEQDYIVRTDKKKIYRTKIELTDRGREVAKRISEYADEYFSFAGKELSESDRDVLYRSLRTINSKLIELCDRFEEQ